MATAPTTLGEESAIVDGYLQLGLTENSQALLARLPYQDASELFVIDDCSSQGGSRLASKG
jgi:hypothetical protein